MFTKIIYGKIDETRESSKDKIMAPIRNTMDMKKIDQKAKKSTLEKVRPQQVVVCNGECYKGETMRINDTKIRVKHKYFLKTLYSII